MRERLWAKIDGASWLEQWYLLPASFGVILAVYCVCTLIELVRQKLFSPLDNSKRIRGFFQRLDERLRGIWKEEEKGREQECRK